jgi:hypothetical protein
MTTYQERRRRLEALEAQADAERQAAETQGDYPDPTTLEDGEILAWAVMGMRWRYIRDGQGEQGTRLNLGARDTVGHSGHQADVDPACAACAEMRFWQTIAERARDLIDAMDGPFIALFGEEVDEALAYIDAGRVDVVPGWIPAVAGLRGSYYKLRLDRQPPRVDENAIGAVNYAVALWARQVGLPQVGSWEMTEVHEWRAWLVTRQDERTHQEKPQP